MDTPNSSARSSTWSWPTSAVRTLSLRAEEGANNSAANARFLFCRSVVASVTSAPWCSGLGVMKFQRLLRPRQPGDGTRRLYLQGRQGESLSSARKAVSAIVLLVTRAARFIPQGPPVAGQPLAPGRSFAPPRGSSSHHVSDGLRNVLGIDSGRVQEFRGRARGRHGPHRQLDHREAAFSGAREGIQNGVAEPALRPVIFHHYQPAPRDLRGLVQGLLVDRLDRIGINDPRPDAF